MLEQPFVMIDVLNLFVGALEIHGDSGLQLCLVELVAVV